MTEHTAHERIGGRVVTLVAVFVLAVSVSTAAAAGPATVRLTAHERVTVSQTTTVDVVVDGVDGGVGAYNVTVDVGDPTVASVADVELRGDPAEQTRRVTIAPDGSSTTMVAALADTADTGRVVIASVTLRGEAVGSTPLDLTVTALGDERGQGYSTEVEATTLTVVSGDADEAAQEVSSPTPSTPSQTSADVSSTSTPDVSDGTVTATSKPATDGEVTTPPSAASDGGVDSLPVGSGVALIVALSAIALVVFRRNG